MYSYHTIMGNFLFLNFKQQQNTQSEIFQQTFSEKYQARSWSSQCLVCGSGDYITVVEGIRSNSSSNKSTDMGHISQKICSTVISDFPESFVV